MMSSDELRQWREVERMKLTQLEDHKERLNTINVIRVLSAVLGDDE